MKTGPQNFLFIEKLCNISDPYLFTEDLDQLFIDALKENINWHYNNSDYYNKLLKHLSYDPRFLKTINDLEKLPFISANFFKTHVALSIPKDKIKTHLTSSGTSGQKSQMFFDERSLGSAQQMIDFIFKYYGWWTPETTVNYLLFSYEPKKNFNVGTSYTDNFLCKYAPSDNVFYALRNNGDGGHEFDLFGTIDILKKYEKRGRPVRIFGFPAFLHFTLEKLKKFNIKLTLSEESFVFLGGGWKGYQDKSISKNDLYKNIHTSLGIKDDRIRDGFGSVEHCIPYIECEHHQFHVPVWSRVLIRDIWTLDILEYGKKGFLQFISPYITSVPAQNVLMGDLASLFPGESCPCSLNAPYFIVYGRAGTSQTKSCAIAASELLKGEK